MHGLAGEIVQKLDPYTEADPVAVLASLLLMMGNVVGRHPHFSIGLARHAARINVLVVGVTSKGRKGTSLAGPKALFGKADPDWHKKRFRSGLSSGEGVIQGVSLIPTKAKKNAAVSPKKAPPKKAKASPEWHAASERAAHLVEAARKSAVEPKRVNDKRLLIVEEEFAATFAVMERHGNTLSPVIRQAWDDGNLGVLTRNDPLQVHGSHISILGHITNDELKKCLTDTHKASGLANRFLFVLVERSKVLPSAPTPPEQVVTSLAEKLAAAVRYAKNVGPMTRDVDAEKLWGEVYGALSDGRPGLVGAILNRAEAQVLRLSMIYALLDSSAVIGAPHLEAALALWDYSERSVHLIFGGSTGDSLADRICRLVRQGPLSQTELSAKLGHHISAAEIDKAVRALIELEMVEKLTHKTNGRPKTVLSIAKHANKAK